MKSRLVALPLALLSLLSVLAPMPASASVIYGDDTRVNYSELKDSRWKTLADSVPALFISNPLIEGPGDGTLVPQEIPSVEKNLGFCKDERFSQEPSLADCSGVLISPRQVLTASHCILSRAQCETTRIVFGYYMVGSKANTAFAKPDVYSCRAVRHSSTCSFGACDPDLEIVELDRDVTGRAPVGVPAVAPRLSAGMRIVSAGYTVGMPLKFDLDGRVLSDPDRLEYKAALDIGPGNSGGPVFDARDGSLIGLTIEGPSKPFSLRPYEYDAKNRCYRPQHCPMSGCADEQVHVQKIDRELLENLTQE